MYYHLQYPDDIRVYSTYDGACVRVSWNVPYSWDGLSYFNIFESSTEYNQIKLVGSVNAPGLTFYRRPPKISSPYSGGGKMQDSHWFYRVSTISCMGESVLSKPTTNVWEDALSAVQSYDGTSWMNLL